MSRFIIENGQVLIIDAGGGVIWKGQPIGGRVTKIVELPGERTAIILFDPDTWKVENGLNVAQINDSGEILWNAKDVTGNLSGDIITDVTYSIGLLKANTWLGKRISIDLIDGNAIYESFTK